MTASPTAVPTGDDDFAALFQPIAFGRATLRNRVAMAPMTRSKSPGGVPGRDVAEYYGRRAAGGVGLVITEGTFIDHPTAAYSEDVPSFFGEAALAGWSEVVKTVHAQGAAIIPQLWHVGAVRRLKPLPRPEVTAIGPVEIREDGKTVVAAMTRADIDAIVESYARAAETAERLGFDGVEFHAGHGYLIDQFFWDETNDRDDEYGGSLERRLAFAVAVIKGVRARVSAGFPLVLRWSQWKATDYDAKLVRSPEELERFLKPLAEAGIDWFHVSTRRYWEPAFAGSDLNLAAWTRKLSGKPVIAVGSIGLDKPLQTQEARTDANMRSAVTDIHPVAERLAAGDFDVIAVGRALLADWEWVAKVREDRFAEIKGMSMEALDTLY